MSYATPLPEEEGSVIAWTRDDSRFTAKHHVAVLSGGWWYSSETGGLTANNMAQVVKRWNWYYLGKITPTGVVATR